MSGSPFTDLGPRPADLKPEKAWPPVLREYPEDHPARKDEESKEAFNRDWAVEDFGQKYIDDIDAVQAESEMTFVGDWWLLALLRKCAEIDGSPAPESGPRRRISEWNAASDEIDRRGVASHLEYACLKEVHLEHADLISAHLEHADFAFAQLNHARFSYAHLEHADMWMAHLEHASLYIAHLEHASLKYAYLEHVNLFEANIEHADFEQVTLTGADLRGVRGLRFDANPVRDIYIKGNAPDPWSVLRRTYTGPWFFVHFFLLLVFLTPHVGKVLALSALDGATHDLAEKARSITNGRVPDWHGWSVQIDQAPAWKTLIGLDQGWWVPALGAVLLVYNILRAILTMKCGQLRDAEERSGISPGLREYMGTQGLKDERWPQFFWPIVREGARWLTRSRNLKSVHRKRWQFADIGLWRLHRLLKTLFLVAIGSFLFHAIMWIATTNVPVIKFSPPPAVPQEPPAATPGT